MSVRRSGKNAVYWATQLPIDYIDTSLTINNYEDVVADLGGGKPVKLFCIKLEQTNNGATAEDIVLKVNFNGTDYEATRSGATSGTIYYGKFTPNLVGGDYQLQLNATTFTSGPLDIANYTNPLIGLIGQIQVKQTSTVDATSAQIEVNIVWEKLVGV